MSAAQLGRSAWFACAATMLAGCASQPEVTATTPLWPFEQLEIETSVGRVIGYVSRPEQRAADRIVVALQAPPCPYEQRERARDTIGTSGVIWQQFKQDSVFFQFERPGGGTASQSMIVECGRAERGSASTHWPRAIVDSVTALRAHERLAHVPAVYIGIGDGAAPALAASAYDANTSVVALVSGTLDAGVDHAIDALARRSAHAPTILLLHAADDTRTPLTKAEALHQSLRTAGIPDSLLIFEQTGFDFGLRSNDGDCLDIVVEALGQHVRDSTAEAGTGAILRAPCATAEEREAAPDIQIENLQRL